MKPLLLLILTSVLLFPGVQAQDSFLDPGEELNVAYVLPGSVDASSIQTFPNPVVNSLNIDLGETYTRPIEVMIFNFIGQELHGTTIEPGQQSAQLDTSDLEPGVYFLKIKDGDREIVRRFLK